MTAALTGFAYWVVGYALPTLGQMPLGLFPKRLLVVGGGLVEIIVASLVVFGCTRNNRRKMLF
jgi:hypothetical protein